MCILQHVEMNDSHMVTLMWQEVPYIKCHQNLQMGSKD